MAEAVDRMAAYERLIGRWSRAAAPAFVDFAGSVAASKVLDAGCGTGALVGPLATRWPHAAIHGVDLDETALQACRTAWPAPRCHFVHADAATLPFADAGFDVVLSMLLLMLVPDPARVAAEARRVLRPGGTAAAATWEDARFELIRGFWAEALALDPAAPCRDGRRHAVERGALRALWHAAGFVEVSEGTIALEMRFDDVDEIWSALEAGVGPAGRYVATLPPPRRDALRTRLARRWAPRRRAGLRFDAALLCVRGRRRPD